MNNNQKDIFKETKLNFMASTDNRGYEPSLKVAVISFNTEAIEVTNSRLEEGKGDKIQKIYDNDYRVASKGWRISIPFKKGGSSIVPLYKKGIEYIRIIINRITEDANDFPDLIFFGMQESNMVPGKSDKSLQSMLYELNKLVKDKDRQFYSLYRSGSARIGKEGYRGNRLGIFIRQTVLLNPFTPILNQKFNKTDCGKESAIVFNKFNDNSIEYTHYSGYGKDTFPKFFCDPIHLKGFFKTNFFEKQKLFTKSNNYGYLSVSKNNKEYTFSIMNLHLPFIKKDIEGEFGAKERDIWLNEIYKSMYIPHTTLLLMGDLNYRFVGEDKKNSLGNISRYGQEDIRREIKNRINSNTFPDNYQGFTCPLKSNKGYSFLQREFKNGTKRNDYGICDRIIYKEGKNIELSRKNRGTFHSEEVSKSDHALVYSVFKIY